MSVSAPPDKWLRTLPWLGSLGYIVTPFNVYYAFLIAPCTPTSCCLIVGQEMLWTAEVIWAIAAFAILGVPFRFTGGFVFRLGLALGLATWIFPLIGLIRSHF